MDKGHDDGCPVEHESADAKRSADLVSRDGQCREAGLGEVDGHVAVGGDRVGMHRDAISGSERHDLCHGLHGADLVVGPEQGHQCDVVVPLEGGSQRIKSHSTEFIDR